MVVVVIVVLAVVVVVVVIVVVAVVVMVVVVELYPWSSVLSLTIAVPTISENICAQSQRALHFEN